MSCGGCAAQPFGGPRFAKLLSLNSTKLAKLAKPFVALRQLLYSTAKLV
jgi:hypothetical protein